MKVQALPTRGGTEFLMPDSEHEDDRESDWEDSPVARGARGSRQALPGTRRRSVSPLAASAEGRAFHAGNVPAPEDIRESWVKHKEDWPMLHRAYIDLLGLTYNFVVCWALIALADSTPPSRSQQRRGRNASG